MRARCGLNTLLRGASTTVCRLKRPRSSANLPKFAGPGNCHSAILPISGAPKHSALYTSRGTGNGGNNEFTDFLVDSEVFPSPFGGAPNKDILTSVKGRFSVVSGYRRGTRKDAHTSAVYSIVPAGPHARSLTQEALEL